MDRRNFISKTSIGSLVAASSIGSANIMNRNTQSSERSIIEWRTYHMQWGKSDQMFVSYLKDILSPAMIKAGASSVEIYKLKSTETPTDIIVQIAHPNMSSYTKSLEITVDPDFMASSKEYDAQESSAYSRLTNSLIHAYTGMPQVSASKEGYNLFEFRLYEGYNEDAVRRKNRMFNVEEIQLFLDLDFHPIFFGEVVVGPYLPAMAYMLNFKDEEDREKKWSTFFQSEGWKTMFAKEEYANTVSNIRNVFMERM